MVTNTQYCLLVGIPTLSILAATVIGVLQIKRFSCLMNPQFDRLEASLLPLETNLRSSLNLSERD